MLTKIHLHGLGGRTTVAGKFYKPDAEMPALGANPTITGQDLADEFCLYGANAENSLVIS